MNTLLSRVICLAAAFLSCRDGITTLGAASIRQGYGTAPGTVRPQDVFVDSPRSPSSVLTTTTTPPPRMRGVATMAPITETRQRSHIQYAIRSGQVQSQGVNLGSWLVAEHWMMAQSSVWDGLTDEVANAGEQSAFKAIKDRSDAVQRFQSHRDNYINEQEIAQIAAAGLNTVRVPVGYWIVGFDHHDPGNHRQWENYAPGGLAYLDTLIRDWARKYNIAVLLSMHAAKGSQNGADHSSPEDPGQSHWSEYPENVASTLDAVVFLADRYKQDEAFLGIGLLNEPSGSTTTDVLYQYYEDAYHRIRNEDQNDCILVLAPRLWEQSAEFMTEVLPGVSNVWIDWHRYFVWGYEDATEQQLLGSAMTEYRDGLAAWKQKSDKPILIGEFSFATAGKFQQDGQVEEFAKKQMEVLMSDAVGGWTFWSWRIDGDEDGVHPWSLRNLIRNNIFPFAPGKKYSV